MGYHYDGSKKISFKGVRSNEVTHVQMNFGISNDKPSVCTSDMTIVSSLW
jgi:hypothetical protein